ncbi:MAG: TPM domain-containing protein, partial [Actinomycetota bacterium]|nr:TPM domain-containing protein [Actinomycetota bacterium]
MTLLRRVAPVLVMALVLAPGAAHAGERIPRFSAPVVDEAGVVPDGAQQSVDRALIDYQNRTGNQVAVAVVRTTGNQSIEDYGIDLAREWGVGQEGKDNGVVLVIAMEDRRARLEVGRGLEGELTDVESGDIIDERVIPFLREGNVGGAITQGTEAIRQALGDPQAGELPPAPAPAREDRPGAGAWLGSLLFLVPLGFVFLGGMRRRRRRWWGGGGFGVPII